MLCADCGVSLMCSAHAPEAGADAEYVRHTYRVLIEDRFTGDDRHWVRATGIGPREAQLIAQDTHPGYTALKAEEA